MSRKTVSLILKGIVIVCAVTGTAISALAGRNTFMGGSRVFMFFTIQSNTAIALVCLIGAVLLIRKRIERINRFAVVVSSGDFNKSIRTNVVSDALFVVVAD